MQALLGYGECEVILGVSGTSGDFLSAQFPHLKTIAFPAPRVSYSRGRSQVLRLAVQLPGLVAHVIREHRRLKKVIARERISAVISDNRYGLFHHAIPSILIIHQVNLIFPPGLRHLGRLATRMQHRWFRKFDQVWIPDLPGTDRVAGKLSAVPGTLDHLYSVGILSRFFYGKPSAAPVAQSYDIMVILSGPEPQRSKLERIITRQLHGTGLRALLVSGLLRGRTRYTIGSVTHVSHMFSEELLSHMRSSSTILCRSGYSSIMDMLALGKTAILIPTPGQPEQEYLAEHLYEKGWFYYEPQSQFTLERALARADQYRPPRMAVSGNLFARVNWLFEALAKRSER